MEINQKYMIPKDSIREVIRDGNRVGFEFGLGVPGYHGYPLSMIDDIVVRIAGLEFHNDPMTFTVDGHTYTFREMETMSTIWWEYGDFPTVFVPLDGGIGFGRFELEVGVRLRGSMTRASDYTWVRYTLELNSN